MEDVAEQEEGGFGALRGAVGEVRVVGITEDNAGGLAKFGEAERALVGDTAEQSAPRVTLLRADAGVVGGAVDGERGQL